MISHKIFRKHYAYLSGIPPSWDLLVDTDPATALKVSQIWENEVPNASRRIQSPPKWGPGVVCGRPWETLGARCPPQGDLGRPKGRQTDAKERIWDSFWDPKTEKIDHFSKPLEFMKIELSCRRELNFRGPERCKYYKNRNWAADRKVVGTRRVLLGDPWHGNAEL